MADKDKEEQQIEAALTKLQKDLQQEAAKHKTNAAKIKRLVEALKQRKA